MTSKRRSNTKRDKDLLLFLTIGLSLITLFVMAQMSKIMGVISLSLTGLSLYGLINENRNLAQRQEEKDERSTIIVEKD